MIFSWKEFFFMDINLEKKFSEGVEVWSYEGILWSLIRVVGVRSDDGGVVVKRIDLRNVGIDIGNWFEYGFKVYFWEDSDVVNKNKDIMMKNTFWWKGI